MKRGAHTKYEYETTLVYEYKNKFFVIQRGQQGTTLQQNDSRQSPAEFVKLYASLPTTCDDAELGAAVLGALDAFDVEAPAYDPWENKKIAASIKSWLGARGQKDIEINSRLVSIDRWLTKDGAYEITPFDNFRQNPWLGPMDQKVIAEKPGAAPEQVGQAVRRAFEIATHNPAFDASKT